MWSIGRAAPFGAIELTCERRRHPQYGGLIYFMAFELLMVSGTNLISTLLRVILEYCRFQLSGKDKADECCKKQQ